MSPFRFSAARLLTSTLTMGVLLAVARPVFAHPMTPQTFWQSWDMDPPILFGIVFVTLCYALGVLRVWEQAGMGHGIRRAQVIYFALGILTLVVALVSPLSELGEQLSAHMAQHMLLILVAAPLLVLGAPFVPLCWALPKRMRGAVAELWHVPFVRTLERSVMQPIVIWVLAALTFLIWHVPAFYELAVVNDNVHALEHLTFIGTFVLFWWLLLDAQGRRRLDYGAAILYLFGMAMVTGGLGALLTFAHYVLYPVYADRTVLWNMTPLGDQQLAGLIMWLPGTVLYVSICAALFVKWFHALEAKMQARERRTHLGRQPSLAAAGDQVP